MPKLGWLQAVQGTRGLFHSCIFIRVAGVIACPFLRRHTLNRLCLRITNSGEPIPAAEREKVFHRFHRGAARQQKIDGVGLGLSLSREIVRAHGGELILEQSTDAGTTFAVRLPLA